MTQTNLPRTMASKMQWMKRGINSVVKRCRITPPHSTGRVVSLLLWPNDGSMVRTQAQAGDIIIRRLTGGTAVETSSRSGSVRELAATAMAQWSRSYKLCVCPEQ